MQDNRNVTDEFKGESEATIVAALDERGVELEIAVENLLRDFSMGTIVRNANAFGVRHVHIIGRRSWNKRGAMATDKYLHLHYYQTVAEFADVMRARGLAVVAVDNVATSTPLISAELSRRCVLVFGAEGLGLSSELLDQAVQTVAIEQFGSTRSVNVGVAAGIVMYEWLRRHHLTGG